MITMSGTEHLELLIGGKLADDHAITLSHASCSFSSKELQTIWMVVRSSAYAGTWHKTNSHKCKKNYQPSCRKEWILIRYLEGHHCWLVYKNKDFRRCVPSGIDNKFTIQETMLESRPKLLTDEIIEECKTLSETFEKSINKIFTAPGVSKNFKILWYDRNWVQDDMKFQILDLECMWTVE